MKLEAVKSYRVYYILTEYDEVSITMPTKQMAGDVLKLLHSANNNVIKLSERQNDGFTKICELHKTNIDYSMATVESFLTLENNCANSVDEALEYYGNIVEIEE